MTQCPTCGGALTGEETVCQSCETPGQHQSGAQQANPGRQGRPASSANGGTSRRELLKYGGGVALGLGGVVHLFGGGGPAETVRNFYDALNRGDTDTAERLRHDDGMRVTDGSIAAMYADGIVSVQNTAVVENTGSKAIVQTTLSITPPDSGDSEIDDHTVELRKQGGEWRIWTHFGTV